MLQVQIWQKQYFIICAWTAEQPNGCIYSQSIAAGSSSRQPRIIFHSDTRCRVVQFFITRRDEIVVLMEVLGVHGDAQGLTTRILQLIAHETKKFIEAVQPGDVSEIRGVPAFSRLESVEWCDASRSLQLLHSTLVTPRNVCTHCVDAPNLSSESHPSFAESIPTASASGDNHPANPATPSSTQSVAGLSAGGKQDVNNCDVFYHYEFNGHLYTVGRTYAKGQTGVRIPITLSYRSDLAQPDGQSPLLLHVYGAYGSRDSLNFEPWRVCLMDQGFVFAVAHVRGGGELGAAWHAAGSGGNKATGIADALACALHLVKSG